MTGWILIGAAVASLAASNAGVAQETCQPPKYDANTFVIEFKRLGTDKVADNGETVERVYGDIAVQGVNVGRFYENPDKKIQAGAFRGLMRYHSKKGFAQSNCGVIGVDGDFLIELADVKGQDGTPKTHVLLHPGNRPSHSDGCILAGARRYGADGKPLPLSPSDPLWKIRRAFYGTDTPKQCPDKAIRIVVRDP